MLTGVKMHGLGEREKEEIVRRQAILIPIISHRSVRELCLFVCSVASIVGRKFIIGQLPLHVRGNIYQRSFLIKLLN